VNSDHEDIRIAVDAMGGDFAPKNIIAGTAEVVREPSHRFTVVLIGPEKIIRNELRQYPDIEGKVSIVDASQVIDMHDEAVVGIKQKPNSSISVGMTLHKEGKVQAFVSAGHSGAVLSTATLILGRIGNISRPTIGAFFPSERGVCLLLDAGANVDCKPQNLREFALMGSIYTREMFGIPQPSVGLVSIGEEESKGNDLTRGAYALLKESKINFIGNVEGRDILGGKADIVVCDGFIGNVLLKFGESIPAFIKSKLKTAAKKDITMKIMGLFMRKALRGVVKGMDYEEYGGVPVLGVKGVVIIGHGKSTAKAVKNMILRAEETVRKKINDRIQEALTTV
jgi:glycerol-3-phosphate acyltransferase PlsX